MKDQRATHTHKITICFSSITKMKAAVYFCTHACGGKTDNKAILMLP